jgi:enterochelin esterase-like enzyme
MSKQLVLAAALSAICCLSGPAPAQMATEVPPVVAGARSATVERIKVHGVGLEGNLEGNSADRDVLVFLPPGYRENRKRRYPVVYALHGYSIGAEQWSGEIHVPQTIEGAFASGAREMIIVLPDTKTVHNGSFYSSSVTTGDFENFIAHELVEFIDGHYRTLPGRESRGLAGHSMGGYGAARIGMKHADVFGALYIMSPCCLSVRGAPPGDVAKAIAAVTSPADSTKLGFLARATLASASAWSPNPEKPPLYLDLPVENGEPRADVLGKWAANAPLAFVDQYVGGLRRYSGIAIDVGDQDGLRTDTAQLQETLRRFGIGSTFEEYKGTHTSAVAVRFQNFVMPFFSKHLCFETSCLKKETAR